MMKIRFFAALALCFIILAGCSSDFTRADLEQLNRGEREDVSGRFVEETEKPSNSALLNATVISVIDGDTIKVKLENGNEERVRMTLIDTPETKHSNKGVQPYGEESSAFTESRLAGKDVTLELDVQEKDQYGRILAYVWLDDKMFNQILVESGLARVAVYPPNTKYVDELRSAQVKAEEKGIGIWSLENYVEEDGYNSEAAEQNDSAEAECQGKIKGNKNSKVYHVPSGEYYNEVSEKNVVWFCTEEEAEAAGYRPAGHMDEK